MTLIADIFRSLMRMPVWVQIWMFVFLVPVNFATLAFLDQPGGPLVASLAVIAILLNVPVLLMIRGFGRLMALSHLILWPPLVVYCLWLLFAAGEPLSPGYYWLLWAVVIVDTISIIFDVSDFSKWLKGDRTAA